MVSATLAAVHTAIGSARVATTAARTVTRAGRVATTTIFPTAIGAA